MKIAMLEFNRILKDVPKKGNLKKYLNLIFNLLLYLKAPLISIELEIQFIFLALVCSFPHFYF